MRKAIYFTSNLLETSEWGQARTYSSFFLSLTLSLYLSLSSCTHVPQTRFRIKKKLFWVNSYFFSVVPEWITRGTNTRMIYIFFPLILSVSLPPSVIRLHSRKIRVFMEGTLEKRLVLPHKPGENSWMGPETKMWQVFPLTLSLSVSFFLFFSALVAQTRDSFWSLHHVRSIVTHLHSCWNIWFVHSKNTVALFPSLSHSISPSFSPCILLAQTYWQSFEGKGTRRAIHFSS